MKFGTLPIDQAQGAILAHSVRVGGRRIAKGHVIGADDLEALRAAGIATVMCARLGADDVAEDAAAGALAAVLAHPSLALDAPSNGRVNARAGENGLCLVDAAAIGAMNAVHESMTIATVPPFQPMRAGDVVATVKIIPFAVPAAKLETVRALAAGHGPALRVQAFVERRVGVVFSELPNAPFPARAKASRVLDARLAALGGGPVRERVCRHEASDVAAAIEALRAEGCDLLLLFGASAIVDRGDVIPAAIERAGGAILYFGMPVEPGNMLLLGRMGEIDVVGLPGCARSPAPNGFDWVLERLYAGLEVTGRDIAAMGVGGLLKGRGG